MADVADKNPLLRAGIAIEEVSTGGAEYQRANCRHVEMDELRAHNLKDPEVC